MEPMALWKRILVLLVCGWGIVAATPNLFYGRVERHNDAVAAIEAAGGVATPAQEAARAEWPEYLPSALVNLGLDL
ncbi:MAG: protein translocase subunit SecD, partial [Tabrizicola sp.]